MSLFAKIMVIVNFILAAFFLAAAGTLLGAAEDYKGKYEGEMAAHKKEADDLRVNLADREAKLTAAGKNFGDLAAQKAAADSKVTDLTGFTKTLEEANRETRADLAKLADAQKDLQGKLADLNSQLSATRNDLSAAQAAGQQSDAKIKALNDQIAALEQDKMTAEKNASAAEVKSNELSADLEAKQTLLARYEKEKGKLTGGISMIAMKGVVQAVDNKVDIYVISVGSKDKVEVGYEFTVYRGSEYVSTIVIDKVFPNYSSGTTKPGSKKRDVQAGDECTTSL